MSKILKKYKARIFGEIYTVVSDEDDGFVLEVVQKVDQMMKELAAKPSMMGDEKKNSSSYCFKSNGRTFIIAKKY